MHSARLQAVLCIELFIYCRNAAFSDLLEASYLVTGKKKNQHSISFYSEFSEKAIWAFPYLSGRRFMREHLSVGVRNAEAF